jgi:hypothetical protein
VVSRAAAVSSVSAATLAGKRTSAARVGSHLGPRTVRHTCGRRPGLLPAGRTQRSTAFASRTGDVLGFLGQSVRYSA